MKNPVLPRKMGRLFLQEVLKEYPGLAKTFNTGNTTVVFATGDRSRRGLQDENGTRILVVETKRELPISLLLRRERMFSKSTATS